MPTIEERVAYLEGQVSEQSHGMVELRDAVRQLALRVDTLSDSVDRRFQALDSKMSHQFFWLVGMQVTTLAAIVAALVGTS